MPSKGLVYYTDNHGDAFLLETCRKQLLRCVEEHGYPIVSVSHRPLDFGTNFVMNLERSVHSIFRQMLKGTQESTADIIFFVEHDMLYHPSHFDFTPERKDTFYYDKYRYSVCDETGKAIFIKGNMPSMMCAYRDLIIEHYSKVLERIERYGWTRKYGYAPPKGLPVEEWVGGRKKYKAKFPTIDIRREDGFSRKRMRKKDFRKKKIREQWKEFDSVPGWGITRGRFNEFLLEVANEH